MRHGYSPMDMREMAEEIIRLHPRPHEAALVRDDIVAALQATSQEDDAQPSPTVVIALNAATGGAITVTRQDVTIVGRRYQFSPSMPGIHAGLPRDVNGLERLRDALRRHHQEHGTRLPRPDHIHHVIDAMGARYVYDAPQETAPLGVPGTVDHQTDERLQQLAQDLVQEAEGRHLLTREIRRMDTDAPAAFARSMEQAGCRLQKVERTRIEITPKGGLAHYDLQMAGLSSTLRPEVRSLEGLTVVGSDIWHIPERDAYLREQRKRRKRAKPERHSVEVDAVLAAKLLRIPNRAPARRTLFALAQGQEHRRTDWPEISHAKADNGRIVARVVLAPGVSWRDGELVMKGRTLPETVLASLAGRGIAELVEHELLDGATITTARNTRQGLAIRAQLAPVGYAYLWKALGGD